MTERYQHQLNGGDRQPRRPMTGLRCREQVATLRAVKANHVAAGIRL